MILPSLIMKLATFFIRLSPAKRRMMDADKTRKTLLVRPHPPQARLTARLKRICDLSSFTQDGQDALTLTPRKDRSDLHILYLHGGGYTHSVQKAHWGMIEQIIRATGATVTVPFYALAPKHTHQVAFRFVDTIYERVLAQARTDRVMIAGDSAGGGYAIVQACRARAAGQRLPDALILFAPWVDLSLEAGDIAPIQPNDPLLAKPGLVAGARLWAGERDLKDPAISPLYDDLHHLPRCMVFQGDNDILAPGTRLFVHKARQSGVMVEYHEYPGCFHVFMALIRAPESRDVYRRIARFWRTAFPSPAAIWQ